MANNKLRYYLEYSTAKINVNQVTTKNYISTENMLSNAQGVTEASNLPISGKCTNYMLGDILLSNIRPYFRKVWFAARDGGCSNDVLCFKTNKQILGDYAYYIISSQKFIDYVMSTAKGTKMPRGDKNAILNYPVNIPTLKEQQEIIDIIKPIEKQITIISNILTNMEKLYHLKQSNKKISMYVNRENTGYAYKKEDKSNEGKYRIFTIKNISRSDKYECTDIIHNNNLQIGNVITGLSGTIGTATQCLDIDLVSNQRTLALDTIYPVQIALAIEKQSEILLRKATGAVQKNITKTDILKLNFEPVFDKEYDEIIVNLKIQKNKLSNLRDRVVKLVMN